MPLAFSQACENNKMPILSVLQDVFSQRKHVLEIGSGTGQHAVHFAAHLPQLIWQTSDQAQYLDALNQRLTQEGTDNLKMPYCLDVSAPWPKPLQSANIDAVFTANTLHIMDKTMVEAFFSGLGTHLPALRTLCIYGPFNYQGQFTSDSNRAFNVMLQQRQCGSAIRDIEWICELAAKQGLQLEQDVAMPANNRLLHFCRR